MECSYLIIYINLFFTFYKYLFIILMIILIIRISYKSPMLKLQQNYVVEIQNR